MNCQQFPNPNNNEWLNLYNKLVLEVKANEDYYKEYKKTQPKRDNKTKTMIEIM